ncbi:prepilin-type N-terminal cleavage/methylation domain-containing protein, partial [bacterium]|nr:prepilin-type N-terminal cleavage/methylation domain-containing protein [bacterium]
SNTTDTSPCHYEEIADFRRNPMTAFSLAHCGERVGMRGFTLAEVLITLGIIGVVAALTIPTLMQKTNERETVSKVKKDYAMLSNALKLAKANDGKFEGTTAQDWYDYLSPYLLIRKYCGSGQGCWADTKIKSLDGTEWINMDRVGYYIKAMLNDGQSMQVYAATSGSPEIRLDINGVAGPNVAGIDIFTFGIDPQSGDFKYPLRGNPDQENYPDDGDIIQGCDKKLTGSYNGGSCAGWIFYNENMDYLHCDDLSWNGKTKCD